MQNWKKMVSIALVAALAAGLVACADNAQDGSSATSENTGSTSDTTASDREYIEETLNLANNDEQTIRWI